MDTIHPDQRRAEAERALGHEFRDPDLLERALTHASVCDTRVTSNERMEFLGDAILGAIACERIYHRYPKLLEGQMTKIKSVVVSRRTCAKMARELGLDRLLVIGKGMRGQASMPSSLHAAVLESIVAALYLDAGYDRTRAFLSPLLDPFIAKAADSGHQQNYKSLLQHLAQQSCSGPPQYRILEERGPDHDKSFRVGVELDGQVYEASWGGSKKIAEQRAALNALRAMGYLTVDAQGEVHLAESTGTENGDTTAATPSASTAPENDDADCAGANVDDAAGHGAQHGAEHGAPENVTAE